VIPDRPARDADRLLALQLGWALSLLVAGLVLWTRLPEAWGLGSFLGKFSGRELSKLWLVFLSIAASTAGLVLSLTRWKGLMLGWQARLDAPLARLGWLNWLFVVLVWLVYPVIRLNGAVAVSVEVYAPHIWLFGHLALLSAVFLRGAWRGASSLALLPASLAAGGVIYQLALFVPDLSAYPLALGWSETSRYYNASLFFAPQVYGQYAPWPTLHPTRYLLQAIPFLFGQLPLWFHRLWQVLLWVGFTWAGGALLVRRLKLPARSLRWLAAAWVFLFVLQGPVYYHLMACALVVLWGFDSRRFWRSMLVVLIGSLWAGLSRINWFPVPGMLAVVLYLLESPSSGRSFWRYWLHPAAWALAGLAAAFTAQAAYIAISGNPSGDFGSSLASDLLWYRLFPNTTYGPGILKSIVWACLPAIVLLAAAWLPRLKAWSALRLLGVAVVLLAFLAGGLVVSVKIGGGSNLHNLDAFLLMLAVVIAFVFFDRFAPDRIEKSRPFKPGWVLAAWLLLVPLLQLADTYHPLPQNDPVAARDGITRLQLVIDEQAHDGPVLFITARHLLTFGMIKGAALEPDYEKIFLMEMAMSGNKPYLDQFHQDLKDHKFALVITEPQVDIIQERNIPFSEENNAWVRQVTQPLQREYRSVLLLKPLGIEVLAPRLSKGD
jgi:hypothetical protein